MCGGPRITEFLMVDDHIELIRRGLERHLSPKLPEETLRVLAVSSGAERAVLRRNGRLIASWPESTGDVSGSGWRSFELGSEALRWEASLCGEGAPSEEAIATAKLLLRTWELKEELRSSRLGERLRLWELEAIRSLADGIGGILDPDELGEQLIWHLVALLGVRRAALIVGDSPESARVVTTFGEVEPDISTAAVWEEGLAEQELLVRPLRSSRGVLGIVVAADKEARTGTEPFTDDDERLLELFAVQAAVALENAHLYQESLERERLNRELEVAAEIQSHLYPRESPGLEGFEVASRFRPSRFVGGDCFDVVRCGGCLMVLVADVSGKGVGAGLLAAGLHAGLQLTAEPDRGLAESVSALNRYLERATEPNRFATLVMARIEKSGEVVLVSAGHPPVLLQRRDGAIEHLSSTGLPVGIIADAEFNEHRTTLEPGDRFVAYTDGVIEAEGPDGEELGVRWVEDTLNYCLGHSADAVCERILSGVAEATGGESLADDVTVLVVERKT